MSSNDAERVSIISLEFRNYKAFRHYSLRLQHMNVLVGANNCGKSTVVGAFRALLAALRRTRGRSPDIVQGPKGRAYGYWIPAVAWFLGWFCDRSGGQRRSVRRPSAGIGPA